MTIEESHVRVQALRIEPSGSLTFSNAVGVSLISSIVKGQVTFDTCADANFLSNTVDARSGNAVSFTASNVTLRNNIFLNGGTNSGMDVVSSSLDSDRNLWYPSNSAVPSESNSIYLDPMLGTDLSIVSSESPAIGAASPAGSADLHGHIRHVSTPCLGAVEWIVDDLGSQLGMRDAGGRLLRRNIAGRDYLMRYDVHGRLIQYTDVESPENNAEYTYDHEGRRIFMSIGSGANVIDYRFVYDGPDVVAEYIDENSDGTHDRKRLYWLGDGIDSRIGFAEITATGTEFYYYLTDQVGSVLQIVDSSGNVINQYDYDAFGNTIPENTFETIENRYTFHGREFDAHRSDYYFRYRIYLPGPGTFSGPDMNLANGPTGESQGMGSYVAFANNPMMYIDPMGLRKMPREAWANLLGIDLGSEFIQNTYGYVDPFEIVDVDDESIEAMKKLWARQLNNDIQRKEELRKYREEQIRTNGYWLDGAKEKQRRGQEEFNWNLVTCLGGPKPESPMATALAKNNARMFIGATAYAQFPAATLKVMMTVEAGSGGWDMGSGLYKLSQGDSSGLWQYYGGVLQVTGAILGASEYSRLHAPRSGVRQLTEADYLKRIEFLEKHYGTGNVHSLQKHGAQTTGLSQYRRIQRSSYPNPSTGQAGNPTKNASKFLTHRDHYHTLRRAILEHKRTGANSIPVQFNRNIGINIQNLGSHRNRGPFSAQYVQKALVRFDNSTGKFFTAYPKP